jgi:hypothetical protein
MVKSSSMLTRTLAIILFVACSVGHMSGQTGAPPSGREYRLQALYRAGIAQNYEVVEQTTVERTHSDSSKKTYDRKVTYYMTVRCIESMDGIAKLIVNIDSLLYRFSSAGKEVTYDSQTDIAPKNFADLNNYIGPLNRSFEITVSPYGEVSRLTGEQIDFWRDYLQENSSDLDTIVSTIWLHSLDRENLLQYGDLQKRVVPGLRKAVDSTWRHDLTMRVDGVVFEGRATSRLASYTGGLYALITKDSIPVRKDQAVHVYGIPYLSTIIDGHVITDNTLMLSTNGTINDVTMVSNAWIRARVKNETFTHRITSTTAWKLTGQYQW